jgi:hypothetical protein
VTHAVALVGAAVLLAGGLLFTVPVPWGGQVPIGLTMAMSLPALLSPAAVAVVEVAGLLLALVLLHRRHDRRTTVLLGARFGAALVAGATAAGPLRDVHVLTAATAAAAAVLVVELGWAVLHLPGGARRLRSAVPVHLTLACAAVLFAVAVDEVGVAMASVAAFPLLLTRLAFERYAAATATLQQTVQALGLVPELAGLAPLGHSERAACYAAAIAAELGFDPPGVDRIVTATRLHHLGAVRADDTVAPTTPAEVATAGARILRESGFSDDVADLLQAARADGYGSAAPSLAAAVVRVATAFDHAVLDDPTAVDRGLALLSSVSLDRHGRHASGGLLTVVARDPGVVQRAIDAGERFRDAADGLDLQVAGEAQLLPFTHRPLR